MAEHKSGLTSDFQGLILFCRSEDHIDYRHDVKRFEFNPTLEDIQTAWDEHLQKFSEVEHNNAFSKET